MKRLPVLYRWATRFITHDIWHHGADRFNKRMTVTIRYIKIVFICLRSFFENSVMLRSSALAMLTLLSIVPLAALIFAISKGFNIDAQLQEYLVHQFGNQKEVIEWVMGFASSAINNTRGGLLAGVGVLVLLSTVIFMLSNVEDAFNHIWNVKIARNWASRLSSYIALMIIIPLFFVLSSSILVAANYQVDILEEAYPLFAKLSWFVRFLINLIPYILIGLMFTIMYMLIPNTRVQFKAALVAGITAGIAFVLAQNLYIYSQVSIMKFSAIYGSFVAIPLFLLWTKFSWLVVLFGAQLSYAYQNVDVYELERENENLSIHQRKLMALLVVRTLAKLFVEGKKASTDTEIARKSAIPLRSVQVVIDDLVDAGVIVEVIFKHKEIHGYQPASDPHKLTISYVLTRLENVGKNHSVSVRAFDDDQLGIALAQLAAEAEQSGNNKLLIDL